ncbi:hypothetical protein L596_013356 [Steinernema carpocapsae]|uniref:Uncharacterized protein n=1 Tax=Steinernema carpocapsae TaxID=34508 RepID=A0A4U5NZW3_STECR|nr:hypothetical protein L596_013356 [Steinernema carpocapsae]
MVSMKMTDFRARLQSITIQDQLEQIMFFYRTTPLPYSPDSEYSRFLENLESKMQKSYGACSSFEEEVVEESANFLLGIVPNTDEPFNGLVFIKDFSRFMDVMDALLAQDNEESLFSRLLNTSFKLQNDKENFKKAYEDKEKAYKQQLEEAESQVNVLGRMMKGQYDTLQIQSHEMEQMEQEMKELRPTLADKDENIRNLESFIDLLRTRDAAKDDQLEELKELRTVKDIKIKELENLVESLQDLDAEKDHQLYTLKADILDLEKASETKRRDLMRQLQDYYESSINKIMIVNDDLETQLEETRKTHEFYMCQKASLVRVLKEHYNWRQQAEQQINQLEEEIKGYVINEDFLNFTVDNLQTENQKLKNDMKARVFGSNVLSAVTRRLETQNQDLKEAVALLRHQNRKESISEAFAKICLEKAEAEVKKLQTALKTKNNSLWLLKNSNANLQELAAGSEKRMQAKVCGYATWSDELEDLCADLEDRLKAVEAALEEEGARSAAQEQLVGF